MGRGQDVLLRDGVVAVQIERGSANVWLSGVHDTPHVAQLRALLRRLEELGATSIAVDLSDVEFLSSRVVGVFEETAQRVPVKIVCPRGVVARLLEVVVELGTSIEIGR